MANSCRCGWHAPFAARGDFCARAAIEVRLYAEDPAREFLPQSGRIARLDFPEAGPHVRVDTGVRAGDTIPIDYDPMLAKLIVWDEDRTAAVSRLRGALAETRVAGCATNVAFLRAIAGQQAFNEAALDTGFLEHHGGDLLALAKPAGTETLAMAVIGLLCERAVSAQRLAERSPIPGALGTARTAGVSTSVRGKRCVCARSCPKGAAITPSKSLFCGMAGASAWPEVAFFILVARSRRMEHLPPISTALSQGGLRPLRARDACVSRSRVRTPLCGGWPRYRAARGSEPPARLTAPMPGRIAALLVEPGARVEANQPVLILEAMKMEHLLTAPRSGTVKEFKFKLGSQVAEALNLSPSKLDRRLTLVHENLAPECLHES